MTKKALDFLWILWQYNYITCGYSLVVELLLPKQIVWVRFPLSAPYQKAMQCAWPFFFAYVCLPLSHLFFHRLDAVTTRFCFKKQKLFQLLLKHNGHNRSIPLPDSQTGGLMIKVQIPMAVLEMPPPLPKGRHLLHLLYHAHARKTLVAPSLNQTGLALSSLAEANVQKQFPPNHFV